MKFVRPRQYGICIFGPAVLSVPTVDPGIPAPDLRWMWRPRICQNLSEAREVVDGDERISVGKNRKRLVIRSAQLQHEGVYTCLASNGLGESLSPFVDIVILGNLHVCHFGHILRPVKITERPKILKTYDLSSRPSSPIKLRCVARGRPQVRIRWLQNGRPVVSENTLPRHNNAGQLQVFQVRLKHEAAWCSTFSCLRTSQTKESAEFQEGPNHIVLWQTRCVYFEDREFYWETHSELTFLQPVLREHEGIYACQASSSNDTFVNETTELQLLYPPQLIYSQPLKFSIRRKHDYSLPSAEYVTDLLNDHAINSQGQSFQGVRESALPDIKQNLSCYLRSNPLPWRVFWERVTDSTNSLCSNKRPPVTEQHKFLVFQ
ncbi:hypothetical protein T265_07931 [Opisthorchis viverrini]|uniref:Ig-like domain-containing protein n=1 Tax=Opisthorchis viverrini TaxID=6198 RepID=A0A074ZFF9_OPIVI|nr:hypothetical protein T265_07931 [Opisthorchis viverrini]KER24372.1 hypothetical protein T265_07931 [Opisthorchis viverrini]